MGSRRAMRLRLSKIHEVAADRPPGYAEDVISHGRIDGEWLDISDEDLAALRAKYRPALPSLATMAANAGSAVLSEAKALFYGDSPVSEEAISERLALCHACYQFLPGQNRCALCGCYAALKSRLRSQHCPLDKW